MKTIIENPDLLFGPLGRTPFWQGPKDYINIFLGQHTRGRIQYGHLIGHGRWRFQFLENRHLSSPLEYKVRGFLSDDRHELKGFAILLLHDKELAGKIGKRYRNKPLNVFPEKNLLEGFKVPWSEPSGIRKGGKHRMSLLLPAPQTSPRCL